ncbi:hypothetical protein GEV33_003220 [Tenebrio molitor]|uniref:Uncharacterized protein n=1 Tax=Tenebrio molitor TaxID=7067 RepID=A0A8J6HQ63_TENMO|nr:hypothetical protein GEV33_003220 [Tenebrio molitor]
MDRMSDTNNLAGEPDQSERKRSHAPAKAQPHVTDDCLIIHIEVKFQFSRIARAEKKSNGVVLGGRTAPKGGNLVVITPSLLPKALLHYGSFLSSEEIDSAAPFRKILKIFCAQVTSIHEPSDNHSQKKLQTSNKPTLFCDPSPNKYVGQISKPSNVITTVGVIMIANRVGEITVFAKGCNLGKWSRRASPEHGEPSPPLSDKSDVFKVTSDVFHAATAAAANPLRTLLLANDCGPRRISARASDTAARRTITTERSETPSTDPMPEGAASSTHSHRPSVHHSAVNRSATTRCSSWLSHGYGAPDGEGDHADHTHAARHATDARGTTTRVPTAAGTTPSRDATRTPLPTGTAKPTRSRTHHPTLSPLCSGGKHFQIEKPGTTTATKIRTEKLKLSASGDIRSIANAPTPILRRFNKNVAPLAEKPEPSAAHPPPPVASLGAGVCRAPPIELNSIKYDDGIHPGYMDGGAGAGLYEPHVAHRPGLQGLHHSPHLNHAMHPYHANHVNPAANHVMGGAVPDVGKRDKDAIYGKSVRRSSRAGIGPSIGDRAGSGATCGPASIQR